MKVYHADELPLSQHLLSCGTLGGKLMGSFSVWHWLIVLGLFGGVGFAVWRSRKQRTAALATADGGTLKTFVGPSGLGGWLILVVLGQLGGIMRMLKAVIVETESYAQVDPSVHYIIHVEMVLLIAFLGLIVFVTIAMFRTQRRFVQLWKIQGISTVLFPLVDTSIIVAIAGLPFSEILDETVIGTLIGGTIGLGLWWWYMNVSLRVKNTFVN